MTGTQDKPEEDPAEGSRKVIERELRKSSRPHGDAGEKGRDELQEQVKEEVELPQKGAP